jgi:acyl carrier protein
VLDKVIAIAANVFEVPEATLIPTSSPESVETWDSLRHLSFVMALEQEFAIQFTPEEMEELLTIELTSALVEKKVQACSVPDSD